MTTTHKILLEALGHSVDPDLLNKTIENCYEGPIRMIETFESQPAKAGALNHDSYYIASVNAFVHWVRCESVPINADSNMEELHYRCKMRDSWKMLTFLSATLTLEAAINDYAAYQEIPDHADMDSSQTLLKWKHYVLHTKKIDLPKELATRIKQLNSLRNKLVHPKPDSPRWHKSRHTRASGHTTNRFMQDGLNLKHGARVVNSLGMCLDFLWQNTDAVLPFHKYKYAFHHEKDIPSRGWI